jgi:hypothetical protein
MSAPAKRWPLLVHDQARLEYSRLLWKRPTARDRLLRHWTDPRHPFADRFIGGTKERVLALLNSTAHDDDALDALFRVDGHSLRTIVREIPPVFGSFY